MTATAEIRVKDVADALLVPNTALRFTPPARAEQERGGILRALLPGGRWNRRPTAPEAGSKREQHVWLLQDGAPRQVAVTTGASDGMSTEITGGTLQPGDELIVGAAGARS